MIYSYTNTETIEQPPCTATHPQLIFFTTQHGEVLSDMLSGHNLLETFSTHEYGLALAMTEFNDEQAYVVRFLNEHNIYIVAWLLLPPEEGGCFNLRNYPQAVERYHAFREWSLQYQLHFAAVGIDIQPPPGELQNLSQWRLRDIVRRLWLARDNVLFAPARNAYTELVHEIHHDGYEVHVYQSPFLIDERNVGTTLIQRAMDIVDLPADVEVLMLHPESPVGDMSSTMQNAIIASYASSADSIAVGNIGGCNGAYAAMPDKKHFSWNLLKQQILLGAKYTDTIYIFSLESCLDQDILYNLTTMDWDTRTLLPIKQRAIIEMLRSFILTVLLLIRYSHVIFAWLGWGMAIMLLLRRIRKGSKKQRGKV